MIKTLIQEGQNYFELVEFAPFFGDKIYKAGCPICSFSENGNYGFLNTDLLHQAMIKLPIYVKILLKMSRLLYNNRGFEEGKK